MGKFYTSISYKTEDRRRLIKCLNSAQRTAWVSPVKDGFVCVFDEMCDQENIQEITNLGKTLSKQLPCPAIAIVRQEYDLVWYQFYDNGEVLGESRSLCNTFEDLSLLPPQPEESKVIYKAFGIRAHQSQSYAKTGEELIDLINLPVIAHCLGFTNVERDDFELEFDDLADEDMDISLEEADHYNTLEKLGWTRTDGGGANQGREEKSSEADSVAYWPGFTSGAWPRDSQDAEGFLNNGTQKLANGDYNGAIEDFDRVLKVKEDFPEAYYARYNRALARAKLRNTQGAIDDLLIALKLNKDCEKTKFLLAILLRSE